MKKLAISLAVVAALAGAAGAAVPWYIGMETEKYFQTQLNESLLGPNASVTVKVVQYDRGWLGATAVQRIALKADPTVQFDIRHEIDHIPDPNTGWLKVRTTPRWPKDVQAGADYYFGGRAAVTLDSLLRFDGQLTTTLTSPAFSKPMLRSPDTKLTWGGASGTLTFPGGRVVQVKVQAPNLSLSSPGATINLAQATVDANWIMSGPETDWHGDSSLNIAEIAATTPIGKASLGGVRAAFSQRDQGQTLQVGYSLKIGKGETTGIGQAGMAFSNALIDIELDKLDKRAIANYVQDANNARTANVDSRTQMRLMTGLMTELLKASPVLRVKKIGMETAAGAVGGSATLSFDGKDLGQPTMPAEWLQRVSFNGSAEVSRSLLKSMMQGKMQATMMLSQGGAAADPAQIQQAADKAIEDQFQAWGAAGLVQDKGEKLVIQADFSKGKLLVNGQPGDHLLPPMLAPQSQPVVPKAPGDDART